MRKKFLIMLLFAFHMSLALGNEKMVKVGVYVSSIYDFDIAKNSIGADIYFWCNYLNPDFNFENELEILDCNEIEKSGTSLEDIEGEKLFYTKIRFNSRQKYNTINYPFDRQQIAFNFESSEYTTDELVFFVDKKNSKIAPKVTNEFGEWKILKKDFSVTQTNYETSFGDPDSESSQSSRFSIEIEVERKDSMLILFKLITGILVAFLISVCVFWIKPTNIDSRFGLCGGGLFAAIGNKYIVESIVPSTNEVTLMDHLHNITFVSILLIILISVVSLRLYEKEDLRLRRLSAGIDLVSFVIIVALYASSFYYYIFQSLSSLL